MQFHATQIDMISALAFLTRIIPPAGGTLPILSGVQITARDQQILLSATDLTTSLDITIPGEIIEPGQVVLPAGTIRDLIHRLPTRRLPWNPRTPPDAPPSATGVTTPRFTALAPRSCRPFRI